MNPELLQVVLGRAQLMFNSAFDDAKQVSIATRQRELLYRFDQAASISPFTELSELHEPVYQFRSVVADLASRVERGEPISELKALLCEMERTARNGRACVEGIRLQLPKYTAVVDLPTRLSTAETVNSLAKVAQAQRASLWILAFGMPECLSAEKAEDWAKDFRRFLNHAECEYFRTQEEIQYGRFGMFEALFESFFRPGEVVVINGLTASNGTPYRIILLDRLRAHSETLCKFAQKLSTYLMLPPPRRISNTYLPLDKEYFAELNHALNQLHSWSEIEGAERLWSTFEPLLKTPHESSEPDRIKIPVTAEDALILLNDTERVKACLAELILEGERALRIGMAPPDLRADEKRPDVDAQRTLDMAAAIDANNESAVTIEALEAKTPTFDRASEDWVRAGDAAQLEDLEPDTLKSDRHFGIKRKDDSFGQDKHGRIWRKPRGHVWYWKDTLRKRPD